MTRSPKLSLLLALGALGLFCLPAAGCSAGGSAARQTTVLSLQNLGSAREGNELAGYLASQSGVDSSLLDKRHAEITVVAEPGFDFPAALRSSGIRGKLRVVPGAGKGSYLPWAEAPPGADVVTIITDGGRRTIELSDLVEKDRVTVIELTALWCEECRKQHAQLVNTAAENRLIAYRKLEVGDWQTPLGQQYLKDIAELPYTIVFGRGGQQIDDIVGVDLKRLDEAIAKGSR